MTSTTSTTWTPMPTIGYRTGPDPTVDGELHTPVRNAYWHGKSLGVAELQREQDYVRTVQHTLTRLTVGCGVLCGLAVILDPGGRGVTIGAGAAIDGAGRLIVVPRDLPVADLAMWICRPGIPGAHGGDPKGPAGVPGHYQLCLIHHECPAAPAPVLVTGCDTRTECLPGAIEERFRLEARPVGRIRCPDRCPPDRHRLEPGRRCGCGELDCVPLARFDWDGQRITLLTVEGRVEIASNERLDEFRLAGSGGDPTAIDPPRLVTMWPAPGTELDREGSESEWGRWRHRPRIELTFDRPIDVDRIDDPADWLRAWAVLGGGAPGPDGRPTPLTVERIGLHYLPGVDGRAGDAHTLVFEASGSARINALDTGAGFVVLVQARADVNTGPTDTGPVPRPAEIAYAGTSLTRDELDALWDRNELPGTATAGGLAPDRLPDCFGDGYEGGRLHAGFSVAPPSDGPRVTSVFPFNGSRQTGRTLPALEVSGTAPLDGFTARAWLIHAGGLIPLTLGAAVPIDPGQRPRALEQFPSSLDQTLFAELAATVRLTTALDEPLPATGRVLVVAPGVTEAGVDLGAFAGTCLTEEEVAAIHAAEPTAAHLPHIRPSANRMPRATAAGRWIHWTFAWEQTNDVIR